MKKIFYTFLFSFLILVLFALVKPSSAFAYSITCVSPNGQTFNNGDYVTFSGSLYDDAAISGTRNVSITVNGATIWSTSYYKGASDPPVTGSQDASAYVYYPPSGQLWGVMVSVTDDATGIPYSAYCSAAFTVSQPPPTPQPTLAPCQEGIGSTGSTCSSMPTNPSGSYCVLCGGGLSGPYRRETGYVINCPGTPGRCTTNPSYPLFTTRTHQYENCDILDYDCTNDGGYTWNRQVVRNSGITYSCETFEQGCVASGYTYCDTVTGDVSECTSPPPQNNCNTNPGLCAGGCQICDPTWGSCIDDNTLCPPNQYCSGGICYPNPTATPTSTPTPTPITNLPRINKLVINNMPSVTPTITGAYGYTGNISGTSGGTGWINPMWITVNATPGRNALGNNIPIIYYYVAIYDKNSGAQLTNKATFLSDIRTRLGTLYRNRGSLMVYMPTAPVYKWQIWDGAAWQYIYIPYPYYPYPPYEKNEYIMKKTDGTTLYGIYASGANSWSIAYTSAIGSKPMYTAVYIQDQNGNTDFVADIAPSPN